MENVHIWALRPSIAIGHHGLVIGGIFHVSPNTIITLIMLQLAPVLNALVVWWNIPRYQPTHILSFNCKFGILSGFFFSSRVTAGYFYLKAGGAGPRPTEIFDYK